MTVLRLPEAFAGWAEQAAALVNSAPRETDPPEKLAELADVEALLASGPEPPPHPPREADLDALRDLRPRLRKAFEVDDVEAFAAAVNPLMEGDWRMAALPGGAWALAPAGGDGLAEWFGARAARGLAELVLAYGIDRLHVCAADDCLRAVVDVSRNGTRRFCSRTCASRTNVRRHRAAR